MQQGLGSGEDESGFELHEAHEEAQGMENSEGSSGAQLQREKAAAAGAADNEKDSVKVKVLKWGKFEEALARLCGLTAVLVKARVRREALSRQLEAVHGVILVFYPVVMILSLFVHLEACITRIGCWNKQRAVAL